VGTVEKKILVAGHLYILQDAGRKYKNCRCGTIILATSKTCHACYLADRSASSKAARTAVRIARKAVKETCKCGQPKFPQSRECATCRSASECARKLSKIRKCACGTPIDNRTKGDACRACFRLKSHTKVCPSCSGPKAYKAAVCRACKLADKARKAKTTTVCSSCAGPKTRKAELCSSCAGIGRRRKPRLSAVKAPPGTKKKCGPGWKSREAARAGCGTLKDVSEFGYSRFGKHQKDSICLQCRSLVNKSKVARRMVPLELAGTRALPVTDEWTEIMLDWKSACEFALANNLPQPPKPLSEVDRFIEEQASEMEALLEAKEAGNK
jgi:hypothetical protein